jgi:threonine synthase
MLLREGAIHPEQTTVVVLTGHGLKAAEKIGELLQV